MKEATGELNMTVITVIAIVAVGALFTTVVWPLVKRNIVQKTCDSYGTGYVAKKDGTGTGCVGASDAGAEGQENWYCCPGSN